MKSRKTMKNSNSCGILVSIGLLGLFFLYWIMRSNPVHHEVTDELAGAAITSYLHEEVDEADFVFINNVDSERIKNIQTIYVIPGGGPGGSQEFGYPEWTRRRTIAAFRHYTANRRTSENGGGAAQDDAIFLALSAGSLNAANMVKDDGRTIFECQHVMHHLVELGVPQDLIFGDMWSWDTVTNGLTLRMYIEALAPIYDRYGSRADVGGQVTAAAAESSSSGSSSSSIDSTRSSREGRSGSGGYGSSYDMNKKKKSSSSQDAADHNKIHIEVFISDFHAPRVKASFDWLLGLRPSLLDVVKVHNNVVDSIGIQWGSESEYKTRLQHEEVGTNQIKEHAKTITTMHSFYRFLMFGGHKGITNYLRDTYEKSAGAGW